MPIAWDGFKVTYNYLDTVYQIEVIKGKTESITLDGKKIDYSQTDKIGFLTEERSLLPTKTVLEQAIYYGVLKGLTPKEVEERLDLINEIQNLSIEKDIDLEEVKTKFKVDSLSDMTTEQLNKCVNAMKRKGE